jgi:hypothetical protein
MLSERDEREAPGTVADGSANFTATHTNPSAPALPALADLRRLLFEPPR